MKPEQPSAWSLCSRWLTQSLFGLASALVISGTWLANAAEQEPSYKGRLLSDWLGDMRLGQPTIGQMPYEEAIRAMGTNAIPKLLEWMRYEPTWEELSSRKEEEAPHWRPITNLNRYPAQRGQRAGYAFGYLGAVARYTIPELTQLARTASNLDRAERFTGALHSIGPEVIPTLVSLTTNGPAWTQYAAIEGLEDYAEDPAVAAPLIPVLIKCLETNTNTDYAIDGPVERVLAAIGPGLVVPALLTNALQSASARTRQQAIGCLSLFFNRNSTKLPPTLVPAIRAAMHDTDSEVRRVAMYALREMGGWEWVGEEWVRRGTNTLNGITPDFFTNAPAN